MAVAAAGVAALVVAGIRLYDEYRDTYHAEDDGRRPTVSVEVTDDQMTEGAEADTGTVEVRRTGSTRRPLDVHYTVLFSSADRQDYVSPAAATAGGDASDPLTVRVPAGAASAPLVYTPKEDEVPEATETIDVAIFRDPRAYRVDRSRVASIQLVDDEAARRPAAATGLSATPVSETQVNLAWEDNATNEEGYTVEQRAPGAASFTTLAELPPDTISLPVPELTPGAEVDFRVTAVNATGSSDPSPVVTARPQARATDGRRNAVVASEPDRFKGWPVNGGMWSWDDEIVVLYSDGALRGSAASRRHAIDYSRPVGLEQARSRDGGQTWTIERRPIVKPGGPGYPWAGQHGPALRDLDAPVDFTAADLAIHVQMADKDFGESYWYYSTDRARTWNGPYRLGKFGLGTVNARTDYVVEGPDRILLMLTGTTETNTEAGTHPFAVRSVDGGLSWTAVADIGEDRTRAPQPSTVRTGSGLVSIARDANVYASEDDGATWTLRSTVQVPEMSTPFNLVRLPDGRLVVTYGYRVPPFGVRAQVSRDDGRTWGDEFALRFDGASPDLGYARTVVRPDGRLVTAYYFNTDPEGPRSIEATIWDPDVAFGPA